MEQLEIKKYDISEDEQRTLDLYLENKLDELNYHRSIVLLNPMNVEKAKYVYDVLRDNMNVVAQPIEINSKKHILLKYQEVTNERIEHRQIISKAKECEKYGTTQEALRAYKDVLRKILYPRSFIYAKLGALYVKSQATDIAILYFEIAEAIAKKEQQPVDYSEILFNLKNDIPYDERKDTRKIHMKDYEFYDDMNDHYQIKEYEDIFALIEEDGLTIEEACDEFNLTEEDVSIIKLVTARNYYSQKNFKAGDKIFTQVERSKDKTPFIKSLMNEIRTNKKLYPYRNCNKEYIKA